VYTGFARYIPVDADPTIAACNDKPASCTDPNDINTEHMWPQSLGAGEEPARSNMHILFPARADVNTARSNNPFAEIPDADTDQWFVRDETRSAAPPESNRPNWSEVLTNDRFEPRHGVKGDVARAVLYFVTMYPNRADLSFYREQKETLLTWHQQDPVDAAEMRRNIRQASYQGNKLNPFVVDPTLADRAYGSGGGTPGELDPPTNVTATSAADAVALAWTAPSGTVSGYHVYRAPSTFDQPSEATRLTDRPVSETEYTDEAGEAGAKYVYAVTAVQEGGTESDLSERVGAAFYPSRVSATIERSFGTTTESEAYRLVALPGQVDRGVAETLAGEPGADWQAYWDNGREEDFFVSFDGSDRFTFRPGRGFWLLSSSGWEVEVDAEPVSLSEQGATTIPLHDGWNIISNPFDVGVPWTAVQDAHDASLEPLWDWDGGYEQASVFASAASGTAFYFYNDQGLDALRLPYAPADGTAQSKQAPAALATLRARRDTAQQSTVQVGVAEDAARDLGRHDHVAPPGRFAALSLRATRAQTGEKTGRQHALRRDVRPPDQGGHVFPLTLRTEGEAPVTIEAEGLGALGPEAALIAPRTAHRYDLSGGSATLTPRSDTTALQLAVGTAAFVDRTAAEATPERVRLRPPAPNPVSDRATVTYDLPAAADVRVSVYDVLGRRVAVLEEGRREAGTHRVTWRAKGAAPGVYVLRLTADDQKRSRKVVRIR
jgi:hypothetical protein